MGVCRFGGFTHEEKPLHSPYHYRGRAKWKDKKIRETEEEYEQFKDFLKFLELPNPDFMTLKKTILLVKFDILSSSKNFQHISGFNTLASKELPGLW